MLKFAFLAGAMTLAVPAVAQDAPTAQAVPGQSAPTTVDTATVPDSATAAAAAGAQTSATQVADVVGKEFPNYDRNGDGVLSATEFDAWMVALKTANDPSTKATAPATKTWLTQAFAQADTDKNSQVSKAELTGFLSQG